MTVTHPMGRFAAIVASLAVPGTLVTVAFRSDIGDVRWALSLVVALAALLGAAVFALAVPYGRSRRGVVMAFGLGLLGALALYLVTHICVALGECF
jgi:hypothetical protein